MTWYASHIYAESKPAFLEYLKAHSLLSRGSYLVKDLSGHVWPTSKEKHGLPPDGLLVVREICAPEWVQYTYSDAEPLWHKGWRHPVISWTGLGSSANVEVIYPPHLPVLAFGRVLLDEGKDSYPPVPFLRFLKQLSIELNATISFYHHSSGAECAVKQEFAWIFGAEECVYVRYGYEIIKYSADGGRKLPRVLTGTVLTYALGHFDIRLPTSYFALHVRGFEWDRYKI